MDKLPMPFLVFQGGGYDGCIWEWNMLILDRRDGPLVVASQQPGLSGYSGNHMLRLFEDEGVFRATRQALRNKGDWDAEIVSSRQQWSDFCKNYNEGFVRSASRVLYEETEGDIYHIPCEVCGALCPPFEIYHWSYRGNGGIGLVWEGLLCDDCHAEKHHDWVSGEWPCLSPDERREAWQRAEDCGYAPPDVETVVASDELLLPAECVYDREYF